MTQHFSRKVFLSIGIVLALAHSTAQAQKKKIDKCTIHYKKPKEVIGGYRLFHKCLGIKSGDVVASVGAGNGRIELIVSSFLDSIQWTLQDIDTTCLSRPQLKKAIDYHEQFLNKKITSDFNIVLGTVDNTNLPKETFDRIIMVDVYHELTSKASVIADIHRALKTSGRFVILERMARKKGEMHGCKFPKVMESDLISDMQKSGFEMESKVVPNPKLDLTYYTFKAG